MEQEDTQMDEIFDEWNEQAKEQYFFEEEQLAALEGAPACSLANSRAARGGSEAVHVMGKASDFLSGDEAPDLPRDPFFQLPTTTLFVRAAQAHRLGNTLVDFLSEDLS